MRDVETITSVWGGFVFFTIFVFDLYNFVIPQSNSWSLFRLVALHKRTKCFYSFDGKFADRTNSAPKLDCCLQGTYYHPQHYVLRK